MRDNSPDPARQLTWLPLARGLWLLGTGDRLLPITDALHGALASVSRKICEGTRSSQLWHGPVGLDIAVACHDCLGVLDHKAVLAGLLSPTREVQAQPWPLVP